MSTPDMSAVNAPTPFWVHPRNLGRIAADATRGVFYLHGSGGGLSLITGEIKPSSALPGTLSVETEHGTTYLDAESEVEVIEEA